MSYLTVFTATYNRAYCLERPFLSLLKQSNKNFEWLIVDDGSEDNTKEKVESFRRIADFPIIYIHQNNAGKAASWNVACRKANTKYIIDLDSDDELTDNAVELIIKSWEGIPLQNKERIGMVVGHCIDSRNNVIVGGYWPNDINKFTGRKQHKLIMKNKKGEKSCCHRVDLILDNPFPSYPETKYVSEDVVWEKINLKYDQYCVNEVFRIYHTESSDSLSNGAKYKIDRKYAFYYWALFMVNSCFSQITYNKLARKSIVDIIRLAVIIGRPYKTVMSEIDALYKRILISLNWPMISLATKIYYRNTNIVS